VGVSRVLGKKRGVEKMKKNYKLQNTNYKLQITNKVAHELHELTRISEKKERSLTTTKGGHGLHK
jgi:rRNA-processing protein FCF1